MPRYARWIGGTVAGLVGVAGAASCTILVTSSEGQCTRDEDCTVRGGVFRNATCVAHACVPIDGGAMAMGAGAGAADAGDPWACLDQPAQESNPNITVDLKFMAFDSYKPYQTASALAGGDALTLVDFVPLPGTAIEGCSLRDPYCKSPVTQQVVTDDAGLAHLTVPGDAQYLYRISRSDSFPEVYYPGRPPPGTSMAQYPIGPDNYSLSVLFEGFLEITMNRDLDAGPGHIFVTALDCGDHLLGGVTVHLRDADAGRTAYVKEMLPDPTAMHTDSEEATALFLNVRPGTTTVDSVLGARTMTSVVQVLSGSTTYVDVRPRVRPFKAP